MVNRLTTYLKDSAEELKKVTWPTRNETTNYTLMVIGVSLAVSAFLYLLDMVFATGLSLLINRGL
ncbi:preprotein translocase subunit SecE [Candidatus Falkowbacteria bacterium]|nr:preprotein translocase subunit SecE [Candidatus Falkowbacteria bacterium]